MTVMTQQLFTYSTSGTGESVELSLPLTSRPLPSVMLVPDKSVNLTQEAIEPSAYWHGTIEDLRKDGNNVSCAHWLCI
jgi:hypothetical protein